ncbi:transmembrane protein 272-like [Xyrichtys novacula]|nr:transmembrane protein 272-like [Xyrichtys novacula]
MDERPQVEFRPNSAVLISTLVVVNVTWSVVMVAAVALGTLYLDQCPIQPYIPIYLIVFGVSSVLCLCLTYARKSTGENSCCSMLISSCLSLMVIFKLGWFIAGSCWIYPIYPPSYSSGTSQYCQKTTYQFAFIVTTLVWVTLAFMFICSCCVILLTCCGTVNARQRLIPYRGSFYGAMRDSEGTSTGDV